MTKQKRKLMAYIFIKAADLIASDKQDYCCCAIQKVCRIFLLDYEEYLLHFKYIFNKLSYSESMPWFEEGTENCDLPEVRSRRVIGLLLAAEYIEN